MQISWIRVSDFAILSAGGSRYTSNSRYSVHHSAGLGVWTLQISAVQPSDAGEYQCQADQQSQYTKEIADIFKNLIG